MSSPSENGSTAGFDNFYRTHFTRVAGLAGRRLGSYQDGPDAAQEVMVRAWRHSVHRDHPEPGGWLVTTTRNFTSDQIRGRQIRPVETALIPDIDAPDPSNPLEHVLNNVVLVEALSHVSEDHRIALTEVVLHGRSKADVAAELGVPEGTVKSRVHYGAMAMRRVLAKKGFDATSIV